MKKIKKNNYDNLVDIEMQKIVQDYENKRYKKNFE